MTAVAGKDPALLTEAPGGIELLRALIRELAVTGRLDTNCAADESAILLLGRLGGVPLEGALEPLPDNWCWTKFSTICTIRTELVRPEGYQDEPQVAPDCIEKGTGRLIAYRTVRESGVRGPNSRFNAGQIVYSKIRPSLSKVVLVDFAGLCSADMYPIDSHIDPRFQLLVMLSEPFLAQVRIAENRVKMPKLNQESLKEFLVPVPPLAEQHRIVAKVDELMALCDRLEARQQDAGAAHARLVQALLNSLTQARDADEFQACWQLVAGQFPVLFTTPASVNDLWSAVLCLAAEGKLVAAGEPVAQLPIGELLLGDTLNGCSYKPSDTPVGTPILRISAGTGSDDFIVDEADHKWVEVTAAEREKFRLQPNDLLACRFNGNLHYVGAFALYNGSSGVEQIFPDKLIRFRVDDKRALPGYLRFVMNALPARQQIESFCATTVGNIGISATNLKTVKVRVPSMDEQRRIVAKVTELLALCDQLKACIAAAHAKHAQLAEALVEAAVA